MNNWAASWTGERRARQRERFIALLVTHGQSDTRLHNIWCDVRRRCLNKNCHAYAYYGGSGITIAPAWRDFAKFKADVGEPPSTKHTLDRYPDPYGNYEPGNVRWATRAEQSKNKRNNRHITIEGVTKLACEWAAHTGVNESTIWTRISRGWTGAMLIAPRQKSGKKPRSK